MIKGFLNYVEIMTKITSTFAFLLTIVFLYYLKQPINWTLTGLFFVIMFLFDLTTTAINNYIDTKHNGKTLPFRRSAALAIIFVLLGISVFLGLYLAYLTDFIVLLLGGLCFLCGIFYTFGPLPISRQPWGEVLSGVFYGFFIPFLLMYINMPEGNYFSLEGNLNTITLQLQVFPILTVILLAVVPTCTTANIMLANNICDLEQDILVKRYTLPYYLGKKMSLYLFAALYYCTYLAVLFMVLMKILPPILLISLVSIIPVQKNINRFFEKQIKEVTFITSIKNYITIMSTNTLLVFIAGLMR
ncbi:UbiA family prenyltransferase [Clostridium aminobutyricum]|uniref:UbiA family prenyltransferase n=1 Tax=Clostridium aminobutyricum TaxID=33953 RepID=A0A939DBL4_CLOAM|nr:UbiA family prenyltransferase [Clostridium aminobutyricum]